MRAKQQRRRRRRALGGGAAVHVRAGARESARAAREVGAVLRTDRGAAAALLAHLGRRAGAREEAAAEAVERDDEDLR